MKERMTDAEVMAEIRGATPFDRARAAFSAACGRIDQAGQQRRPAGPIEIRRMEFEAVERIAEALDATIPGRGDEQDGHDHADGGCPLCPSDDELAAMRRRNQEEDRRGREDMKAAVEADPTGYVHAIEARDNRGPDIVMHVASTLQGALAWCLALDTRQYSGGLRLHVMPHRLDAPDDDKETGTVSLAVYGVRDEAAGIEDLVGTDDERVPAEA